MRTSSIYLALTLCMTSFSFGCGDDNNDVVTSRSNATADFTGYKTYSFVGANDVPADQLTTIPAATASNLDAVNNAMRDQLNALGLTEVTGNTKPDLWAWNLESTSQRTALSWECVDGYWYGYYAWTYTPCTWLAPVYTTFQQGTIVLGLTDPTLQQVVFGGVIRGVGNGNPSQQELENRINDDVAEVFKDYPANQTGADAGSK